MAGKPGRNMKHGHATKVAGETRTYRIWMGMRRRCSDPKSTPYEFYGGRGIRVCERWREFAAFLADMGECPSSHHSIDRIDANGHYEPGNCRWATALEQNRNSRRAQLTLETATRIRELRKSGVRTRDIAAQFGVHKATIERVLNGKRWIAIEDALKSARGEGSE